MCMWRNMRWKWHSSRYIFQTLVWFRWIDNGTFQGMNVSEKLRSEVRARVKLCTYAVLYSSIVKIIDIYHHYHRNVHVETITLRAPIAMGSQRINTKRKKVRNLHRIETAKCSAGFCIVLVCAYTSEWILFSILTAMYTLNTKFT